MDPPHGVGWHGRQIEGKEEMVLGRQEVTLVCRRGDVRLAGLVGQLLVQLRPAF